MSSPLSGRDYFGSIRFGIFFQRYQYISFLQRVEAVPIQIAPQLAVMQPSRVQSKIWNESSKSKIGNGFAFVDRCCVECTCAQSGHARAANRKSRRSGVSHSERSTRFARAKTESIRGEAMRQLFHIFVFLLIFSGQCCSSFPPEIIL